MAKQTQNEHDKQAEAFLTKTGTEFKATFLRHGKYFTDDKDTTRDIYEITLKRGERSYTFKFGQSVQASGEYIIDGWLRTTRQEAFSHRYSGHQRQKNKEFEIPTAYDVLSVMEKTTLERLMTFVQSLAFLMIA